MDAPQAAASLFGSEDSSNDPFAIIGENSQAAQQNTQEHDGFFSSTAQQGRNDSQLNFAGYEAPTTYSKADEVWNPQAISGAHDQQQLAYGPTSVTTHYEPDALYGKNYGGKQDFQFMHLRCLTRSRCTSCPLTSTCVRIQPLDICSTSVPVSEYVEWSSGVNH